jgi:tetratricopeptide (TPR) repeat protein
VWDKAADYHQQAGDRARGVYANGEAAAHYTHALEALDRLPPSPDPVRVFELRLAREAVNALLGDRAAQAEDLAALEELLCEPLLHRSDRRLAVMLRRAVFGQVTGDYPAALVAVQEAAKQAQVAGNAEAEYEAHLNWGRVLLWQGKLVAARKHIEQAYVLAQVTQDLSAQAATLNELGSLAAEHADYEARKDYYRRALAVCQQSGDQVIQASIYNGLANLSHELADYAASVEHHQQALALRRAVGDRSGEAITLYNIGRVYYDSGDRDSARHTLEQVCSLSHAVGDRRIEGYGYTFLGLILEEMGELDAAQSAYSTALTLRRELGLHALAVDALAGLTRVASAQGNHEQATARADEVLAWLDERGIEGVGDPLLAYKAAYRALFAAGEQARGWAVLQTAYELLMARADGVADPERQRAYLHDIEPNCSIWRDYQTIFARSVVTRLPRADAPTGRPLRDDEYVTVTWTVAAPEDEARKEGAARRQARIQRLLREAADQGAAPTVGDLAAVLDVSEPTVRRDLATLRRAGHPVQTRGSRGG